VLSHTYVVMVDQKDEDLEKIKRKKLEEMMRRISDRTEEKLPSQASDKPVDLTDATFTKFVDDSSLSVIDCWAPWCGPCHMVSPIIEELAREYAGKISFGKLNMDNNQGVAAQYGIRSIPTLLVFKHGKLVDQIIGAMPRRMLEPRIISHL
jgi:thioredoxin